jgi:hypothetical protein
VSAVFVSVALALSFGTAGCRTTSEDIERWANTAQGPRKLVAVLTHDKYPVELRVDAAMTLVRMKPRAGRRVGIENLTTALGELPPAERAPIVTRMVPLLEAQIKKPPPPAAPNQAIVDPSFAYKDGAYALLTQEEGTLVDNPDNRKRLQAALAEWAQTNFAERMDESSQMFGVEQVMRHLGAQGVSRLPEQISKDAKKVDRMSELIAELGNPETKQRASARLVQLGKEVASPRWIDEKRPQVESLNKQAKIKANPQQLQQQLEQYQEEELLRVFSSMKRVGGTPVVDFLIEFSKDKAQSDKKRATAIAALEGHLDKNNANHVQAMLQIASEKETPDLVRDVALRRVGEMPRQKVVEQLYGLFKSENWKVRWVAAELVLRMSDTSHLGEFMNQLGKTEGLAITEIIRYGQLIADMKGPIPPEQVIEKYAQKGHPVEARLSALGFYYERGTKADLPKVLPYAGDNTKVPECLKDAKDCDWKCVAQGDSGAQEDKEIKTVGDFVNFCLKPHMEKRTQPPAKESK